MMPILRCLVDVSRQFLNLQVIETLVHKKIDADDFVELIYPQAADSFENTEEYRAEDGGPGDYHKAAQGLHL